MSGVAAIENSSPSPAAPRGVMRTVWRHRELLGQLIRRDVAHKYRGAVLGAIWSFVTPLVMLGIYTFVFTVIFHPHWSGPQQGTGYFALTLFAGLIPFQFFAEVVNRSPGMILQVPNYVKKVVFPLEVLPMMAVGSALIHALVSTLILLIGVGVLLHTFAWQVVWLPVMFIPLILLTVGMSWFLSSLGTYLRDLREAVGPVVQMAMFLTPIFYPLSSLPPAMRPVLQANPLTVIVDGFRHALLGQEWTTRPAWIAWTIASALIALGGFTWFQKTKRGFADVM